MPPTSMRSFLRATRALPEVSGRLQVQSRAPFSSAGKLPGGTPGEASSDQAIPLGPYYEAILIKPQPIPNVKPEDPPTSSPKSPRTTVKKTPASKKPKDTPSKNTATTSASTTADASSSSSSSSPPEPSAPPSTAQEKARIIFGSRLAGPIERAERLAALRDRSTLVAGVLVPPRPEEPDNCCMSGCVNCVWDRFRDDMEEWVATSLQAEKALQAQQQQRAQGPPEVLGGAPSLPSASPGGGSGSGSGISMDDDGGGSETNWQADLKKADRPKIAKDLWDDDLYKNVPVGIREFMKQEKRLKEKHMREGTFGA